MVGRFSPEEQQRIAEATHVDEGELVYARLLDPQQTNILAENLAYLLGGLGHGGYGRLAERVGIHQGTLSKWLAGGQRPRTKHLARLSLHLGVPVSLDLAVDPLFLSLRPVGEARQRQWLHEHIERLPGERLSQLFPALERLLGDE